MLRIFAIHPQPEAATALPRPLMLCPVVAGFPSPADDYVEARLDLNSHLVRNPGATFYLRVAGDSMRGAGIHDGDILVVDRSLEPSDGRVVVASLNGELTVKRLVMRGGRLALAAANPRFPDIELDPEAGVEVWGVVQWVLHQP